MIDAARQRAYQEVNTALIDFYRQIGEQFSRKLAAAGWLGSDGPAVYYERQSPEQT